ncbi:MAG: hypothetical protein E7462_04575 [Ruminococcaceae bacterium]|nr:hypothetical protein [Oscillospiraceae bacterium]
MKCKKYILGLLLIVTILLSGCNMRTIDQMYCLPKRSEGYLNLKTAMDSAMQGLEYHAPIAGENQQPVQMADLTGDGVAEYIVFAKGSGEKPLKVLIFACVEQEYVLADMLEGNGTAFDQIAYVRFSGGKGYDLIIGRQVSDQVVRPLSVYTMVDGRMQQQFTAHYDRFVCADMDKNGQQEIVVLRPGESPSDNAIVELYNIRDGVVERSQEARMSRPVNSVKRIMIGKLHDGLPAVYVASDVDGNAIITDVYALLGDVFTNVSLSSESGTSVQTLRNYYVYANDIDNDGVLELPDLIPVQSADGNPDGNQHFIHWYAMNSDGSKVYKKYTYHSFTGGWYLELDNAVAANLTVKQLGNSYEFSILDKNGEANKIMTLYVFTGQEREEQAIAENRFVVFRNESTVYAAHLEVASAAYQMTQESLQNAFHLIAQDLLNGGV